MTTPKPVVGEFAGPVLDFSEAFTEFHVKS